MDRRRKNARKLICIITIVCLITTVRANAQQISFSGRDNLSLYAMSLMDIIKLSPSGYIFPDRININSSMLQLVKEFIAKDSTSPGVKKTWLTDDWNFMKNVDTARRRESDIIIKLRKLDLDPKTFNAQKKTPVKILFSPVIYSNDHNKAIVFYERVGSYDVFETFIFYFKRQNGLWTLVNTEVPYFS